MTVYTTFLTPKQKLILLDRLEQPDCLADALEGEYPRDQVESVAVQVADRVKRSTQVTGIAVERGSLEGEILRDAFEGSTWWASRPRGAREILEARALQSKLINLLGDSVSLPLDFSV